MKEYGKNISWKRFMKEKIKSGKDVSGENIGRKKIKKEKMKDLKNIGL